MDSPHELKFAVVDVETSGGAGDQNRITEIGIALFDGLEPVGEYHTLVDPGVPITPFVQNLTGITDEMVSGAPQFSKVAEHLHNAIERYHIPKSIRLTRACPLRRSCRTSPALPTRW